MKKYVEMPDCEIRLAKEIFQLLSDDLHCAIPDTQYQRDATKYLDQLDACIKDAEQ